MRLVTRRRLNNPDKFELERLLDGIAALVREPKPNSATNIGLLTPRGSPAPRNGVAGERSARDLFSQDNRALDPPS